MSQPERRHWVPAKDLLGNCIDIRQLVSVRELGQSVASHHFIKLRLLRPPEVLPTHRDVEWNSAIDMVRDNLGTFAHVRGGRMRASSYVGKSRNARLAPGSRVAL